MDRLFSDEIVDFTFMNRWKARVLLHPKLWRILRRLLHVYVTVLNQMSYARYLYKLFMVSQECYCNEEIHLSLLPPESWRVVDEPFVFTVSHICLDVACENRTECPAKFTNDLQTTVQIGKHTSVTSSVNRANAIFFSSNDSCMKR